jgi:molecular chaperone DnaK (HSP70)
VGYCLDVDLGTTFVAAACSGHCQAEMPTLGDRSVVMPSSVYVSQDGTAITGFAADRRAGSNPDRVARQFKRRLGDPTPLRLGETSYPATELLAILLRDVLAKVTETEGEPPGHVTLTRAHSGEASSTKCPANSDCYKHPPSPNPNPNPKPPPCTTDNPEP